MSAQPNVLLVDDHAVVRAGFRLLLSQSGRVAEIREVERGEEACQHYASFGADVIVMDLSLPGIGGLATIRRICARDPRARILACSMHNEAVYVTRAIEAGARGYVSKSSAPDILLEAVLQIAAGEIYFSADVARAAGAELLARSDRTDELNTLSAREFDIFMRLAQGLTTREVADELCLSYKTVANYTTLLKTKLGAQTSAELARLAYRCGVLKG
ncbi:response regulator transcription factor [Methylococcus sp. EFPC2]|uniref:response regulator n=1 Tax=Methylococcus sp. EFPC2 TaxID=2812648 RepID=UPI0019681EEB|nr:response regulator transcription factor [Methylococcus sp. EFPC2]QSA96232.1 response regulator transcription factor [Methylococcus sp. EFPC2]